MGSPSFMPSEVVLTMVAALPADTRDITQELTAAITKKETAK